METRVMLQEVVGEPTMTKEEAEARWHEQRRLQHDTAHEEFHPDATTTNIDEADDDDTHTHT